MKHFTHLICACAFFVALPILTMAQGIKKSVFCYDEFGNVKSVLFSSADRKYDYIKSEGVFFRDILKVKTDIVFVRNTDVRLEKGNDTYEQYYKGLKVEDAGYTFHYDKNGSMRYAHGNYVDISNLDTKPAINEEDAAKAFAKYKGLLPNAITCSSAELLIKRIKGVLSVEIPMLVYKVTIAVNNICVTEYGYVDAKTGDVVHSESYIYNSAATGTIYTKYYGTKTATTNLDNGYYYLHDPSRGNGIEIKNIQNHNIYDSYYMNYALPIKDSDNYWYYSDYADSTFMAFDVHWAFQKIYDRLYNVHSKNGMNNYGKKVMAYVNANFGDDYTDNACWEGSREELYFGRGDNMNRPFSTLDIVAHEYGHGITKFQIGWSQDQGHLNEGLSDIWAAIMDYRFGDTNTEVWKFGEHLFPLYLCIRDIEHPDASSAYTPIASTYNSVQYNQSDKYGKSGVFSHWFYLLVNGGQGYNSNNTYYSLNAIGMDMAENLIVKAVYDNYLRYTTTYEDVRNAFIAAAETMNNDSLAISVNNAWYAVGVGSQPSQIGLSGPSIICQNSINTYTVNELPSFYNVTWAIDNSDFTITPSGSQCMAAYTSTPEYSVANLTATISCNGVFVKTLTKRIVMHDSNLFVQGYQPEAYVPDGYCPQNYFTITDDDLSLRSFNHQSTDSLLAEERSLPIVFVEEDEPRLIPELGVPNIYGGNNVTLTSTRFDDMDISFSGTTSPEYYNRSGNSIVFRMPTNINTYSVTVNGSGGDGCHDFSFRMNVIPPHGMTSNDPNIFLSLSGTTLSITFEGGIYFAGNGQIGYDPWNVAIYEVPSLGSPVYSVAVPRNQTTINVNTSSWSSGYYLIRVTQNGNVYTKKLFY